MYDFALYDVNLIIESLCASLSMCPHAFIRDKWS